MKKRKPTFDEFIKLLQNGELENLYLGGYEGYEDCILWNFLYELEKETPFVHLCGDGTCGWELDKKTKNTITIFHCDETGTANIKVFAYLVGEGVAESVSLVEAKVYQGQGIDNDLDDIYAKYKKRDDMASVLKSRVERKYNEIIKKHKLYIQ